MTRQAIKSYAIDPAHTTDSHAIDRARSNRLRIVSVCDGYYMYMMLASLLQVRWRWSLRWGVRMIKWSCVVWRASTPRLAPGAHWPVCRLLSVNTGWSCQVAWIHMFDIAFNPRQPCGDTWCVSVITVHEWINQSLYLHISVISLPTVST